MVETETTDAGKNSVESSSELHAFGTVSCEQGQCGDSLCLEAGWNPPQASPFALATGHWCAYRHCWPDLHLPRWNLMQMPLPSLNFFSQASFHLGFFPAGVEGLSAADAFGWLARGFCIGFGLGASEV